MFDIGKYENVTMLRLPDSDRELLGLRAGALSESFNAIEKINTEGIEPLVNVLDTHTVLRDDIAEKKLTRDEVMANAPEQHDGYFQVPGTLE